MEEAARAAARAKAAEADPAQRGWSARAQREADDLGERIRRTAERAQEAWFCAATTRRGYPCMATPQRGSEYCYQHDPVRWDASRRRATASRSATCRAYVGHAQKQRCKRSPVPGDVYCHAHRNRGDGPQEPAGRSAGARATPPRSSPHPRGPSPSSRQASSTGARLHLTVVTILGVVAAVLVIWLNRQAILDAVITVLATILGIVIMGVGLIVIFTILKWFAGRR
jgi:hypothetical protein